MVGELVMDLVPGMPCDNGAKVADGASWWLGGLSRNTTIP